MSLPNCDMKLDCAQEITYIDHKGYVYCTEHGQARQATHRCRKLRRHEVNRLRAGDTIRRY